GRASRRQRSSFGRATSRLPRLRLMARRCRQTRVVLPKRAPIEALGTSLPRSFYRCLAIARCAIRLELFGCSLWESNYENWLGVIVCGRLLGRRESSARG